VGDVVTVIAVVTDLIFSTKITGTAKALGAEVRVARNLGALKMHLDAQEAEGAGGGRGLVIVDLNASGVDPIEAVRVAKAHGSGVRVVAFLSHVQADLAAAAREAGADAVMARSAFVEKLPGLVGGGGAGGAAG
jgi:DNA-binding NarL/FixJ family response regulator